MVAPPLLRMFGLRVVVSRRDMGFWYRRWNLALLRIVVPFVDRYVANSQAVKRIVEAKERVPRHKVHRHIQWISSYGYQRSVREQVSLRHSCTWARSD